MSSSEGDTARDRLEEIEAARAAIMDEARPEAVAKRRAKGLMTTRERIATLLDPSAFREFGSLVEPLRATEWNKDLVAPADGIICGSGRVEGRPVMIYATDFTVQGGSTGRHGMLKHARVTELAKLHGAPVVYLLEGGGHRIQDGLDARYFSAGSSVFRSLAQLSGWVPVVSAMMGPGFAGPTNYAGLSDFVIMIRGVSTMGIAGPALVKAATGEDIDKEELGGAAVQADKNGLADLVVDSEQECLEAARKFLSYLPSNSGQPAPVIPCEDPIDRREESLLDIVPADTRKAYDVRKVVALIADVDSVFEIKPGYARNVVTSFARLDGRPVGFIANQPMQRAGTLDAAACEKMAHFVALCDAYGLPLVMLMDVPGFAVGTGAEKTGLGRRSARLFYELAHITVPRITVSMRKGYGAAYYAMGGGRSFEADAVFCWPTAELSAMQVEGAVDVAYRRDYEASANPEQRRAELIATFKSQLGARQAAEFFGIDEVIDPRDTRWHLIQTLAVCPARRQSTQPPKVRSISPI
ncbi:MAG: acyl-CoA carboxylase subunit beta [Novosphingobium sp.]